MRAIILARVVRFVLESRRGVICAVVGATSLFGLFEYLVSSWCLEAKLNPTLHAGLQASIVGLGAGLAFWLVLAGLAERRKLLADELCRVAELNHAVRNSLEVIVLAHHAPLDCDDHKIMVLECTDRIDKKLKELFPVVGRRAPESLTPGRRVA